MARRSLGIVLNGVTGRIGHRRHLLRSILAIRGQGGLRPADGTTPWPEPVPVGRDAGEVRAPAERHGPTAWTADLAAALERSGVEVCFDAQATSARAAAIRAAVAAGEHVHTEKPLAADKVQWEMFLRHVAEDAPFPWDFHAGARGVRLAELGMRAWREGRRLVVPELSR